MPGGKHVLGKINQQRVFGTAKVGDRGQIVIPKEARELIGIKPGGTLLILGEAETGLIVSRPDVLNNLADEILNNVKKRGLNMDELLELYETMGISPAVYAYGERTLEKLKDRFAAIDQVAEHNQAKVLWAMQKNRVSAACFAATTGYGYDDFGRDNLERIYARIFGTEAALVRPQITCGTHALALALAANLLALYRMTDAERAALGAKAKAYYTAHYRRAELLKRLEEFTVKGV